MDLLCFCSVLCLLYFVRVCLYVLCGHLLGKGWPLGYRLWCLLWVCHFPIGILGQVWYLIVSIPDLCNLITYYYIESQYLTHVVNTHHWGQGFTARGHYYYIESQFLTHEVSTHPWRQVSTAIGQYIYIVSNIWHMKSVHITETKILLIEVSTTTLSPSI